MSVTTKQTAAESALRLVGRCASCHHWQLCPTQVMPTIPGGDEMICGKSRIGGYGLHGQDGRPIITPAEFGCILYQGKV